MNTRKKQSPTQKSLQEGSKTSLKAVREAIGLSQLDFCKQTDLTIGSVSKCENGKTEMLFDINQAQKFEILIQSELGLSIRDLPKSLKDPAPIEFLRRLEEIKQQKLLSV